MAAEAANLGPRHHVCWSNWVDDLYDDDGVGELLDRVPEEDVGNLLDLSDGDLGQRGVGSFDAASLKTGCLRILLRMRVFGNLSLRAPAL